MAVRLVLVSVAVTALACEETDPPHDDSLCSWATDGEACSPLSPRDLFDVETMVLMWSSSDDGVWNEPTQAEWTEVAMTANGNTWTSPPVPVQAGKSSVGTRKRAIRDTLER